jgi:hypothetical protein
MCEVACVRACDREAAPRESVAKVSRVRRPVPKLITRVISLPKLITKVTFVSISVVQNVEAYEAS